MVYIYDLLERLAVVRSCGEKLGFRSAVGVSNLALDIEKSGLQVRFQPRFLYIDEKRGGRNYTLYFQPGVIGFSGWLPYFNKVWPISIDKLAFKSFAAAGCLLASRALVLLLAFVSVTAGCAAQSATEKLNLERQSGILEKMSTCALDLRLRDGLLVGEAIRLHVPSHAVLARDGYAIVETSGQFHGFEIVRIVVPTTETRDVFDLLVLTLRAPAAELRRRLLNDWGTNFLPVPPPGKMGVAFASDNSIPRLQIYAETAESSVSHLECNFMMKGE